MSVKIVFGCIPPKELEVIGQPKVLNDLKLLPVGMEFEIVFTDETYAGVPATKYIFCKVVDRKAIMQ